MYEPPLHRQEDVAALHALMRAHPLALLVSHGPSGLLANAIPFTLVDDGSRFGLLRCHLARANPQWRDLQSAAEALVVFQGADAYVTPSWYATKRETGKVVPTWNYQVVQARGAPRVVEAADWLRAQVEQLTREREASRADALGGRRRAGGFRRAASCAPSSASNCRFPISAANGRRARTATRPTAKG